MQAFQWYAWFLKRPFNLGDIKNIACITYNHHITSYAK